MPRYDFTAQPLRVAGAQVRIDEVSPRATAPVDVSFVPFGAPYLGYFTVVVVKDPFPKLSQLSNTPPQWDPADPLHGLPRNTVNTQRLWKVTRLQRFHNGVWSDVPVPAAMPPGANTSTDPKGQMAGFNWQKFRASDLGQWKITVQVGVTGHNMANQTWEAQATRDVVFEVSQRTLARQQQLIHAQQNGQPYSTRLTRMQSNTSYIAHLEWKSPDVFNTQGKVVNVGNWKKVPMPGDADYPLTVAEHASVLLRAVRRDPKLPWPNSPQLLPAWSRSDEPDLPMYGAEASFSVFSPSHPEPDNDTPIARDSTVSATCGNTVKTTIRVVSKLETDALAQLNIFLLNNGTTTTSSEITAGSMAAAKIGVFIQKADTLFQQEGLFGIRLHAFYADGSSAGTFRMSRAKDSQVLYVSTNNNRSDNEIEYSTAPRTGTVSIVAEAIYGSQKTIRSAPITVKLVEPVFTVSPGSWEWDGDHWQRKLRIEATTNKGLIAGNLRFRLRVVTPKGYDTNQSASWFDAREGQTTEYGWADMTQNWKFVPGASLNMDSYQVEATPVLESSTQ